MRLYIVGSPESIYTDAGYQRDFTKNDLTKNLNALSSVRVFNDPLHASNYARSLRIAISRQFNSITGYIPASEKTKLAPIIHVDVADTNAKYQFDKATVQTATVNFKKYIGTNFNFLEKDSTGRDIEVKAGISFISLPKASFDMNEIKMIALEFADSKRPAVALNYSLKCRIL